MPYCRTERGSPTANLLKETSLIVIDEVTLLHRKVLEAVDNTLKDLMNNNQPFGGIITVFAGDLKQCLPVIPGATRGVIVASTILKCSFWCKIIIKELTTSMRLNINTPPSWITFMYNIGHGILDTVNMQDHLDNIFFDKQAFINNVFPNYKDGIVDNFVGRTILALTNEIVDDYNKEIVVNSEGMS